MRCRGPTHRTSSRTTLPSCHARCGQRLQRSWSRAVPLMLHATVLRPDTATRRAGARSLSATTTSQVQTADLEAPAQAPAPVLLSKLVKAHAARVSALLVLKDRPDCKVIVSSSLDKSLLVLRLGSQGSSSSSNGASTNLSNGTDLVPTQANRHLLATRLTTHAAVFSIVRQPQPPAGMFTPTGVFTPSADVLYIGNAAKEVVAWEVRADCGVSEPSAVFQTVATDYTGWVRSLALMGKWLFSCGCNVLVQHDTSFPIPKEVSKQELFKGDIQSIVTNSTHVYVASADGVIRSWKVSKTGAMEKGAEMPAAHGSRITGMVLHGSTLYSTSFDGAIKAWNADSLAPVAAVPAAHGGTKVHTIVLGPDGLLYTGGDDKLIRCWRPLSPALDFLAALEPVTSQQQQQRISNCNDNSNGSSTTSNGSNGNGNAHSSSNGNGNGVAEVVPIAVAEELPTLPAIGTPLSGHEAGVCMLAAGSNECLVSGDADGDMCIWALPR